MTIFAFKALVLAALHLLVFVHLAAAFGRGRWMLAAVPWFAAMSLGLFLHPKLGWGSPAQVWLGRIEGVWQPLILVMAGLFVVTDTLFLLRRIRAALREKSKPRARAYRRAVRGVTVVSLLFISYAYYEARTMTVTELTLESTALPPESERIRVAFVTDIHLNHGNGPGNLAKIVAVIKEAGPDIILLGGDTVDRNMSGRDEELLLLQGLSAPLGKFAVLGNHDVGRGIAHSVNFHTQAGFRILRHEWVETGGIVVAGVDDPHAARGTGKRSHEPVSLLRQIPGSRFTILLKHRPTLVSGSSGLFDLQLSGHSHGGQIWPLNHVAEHYFKAPLGLREYPATRKDRSKSTVYVSQGTGFSHIPLRFRTPPEVVIIDIVRPAT